MLILDSSQNCRLVLSKTNFAVSFFSLIKESFFFKIKNNNNNNKHNGNYHSLERLLRQFTCASKSFAEAIKFPITVSRH